MALGVGVLDERHVVLAGHAGVGRHEVRHVAASGLGRAHAEEGLGLALDRHGPQGGVALRGEGRHVAHAPGAGVRVGRAVAHDVREGAVQAGLRGGGRGGALRVVQQRQRGGRDADELVQVHAVRQRRRDGQRPLLRGPGVAVGGVPGGGEVGGQRGDVQRLVGGQVGGAERVVRHAAAAAAAPAAATAATAQVQALVHLAAAVHGHVARGGDGGQRFVVVPVLLLGQRLQKDVPVDRPAPSSPAAAAAVVAEGPGSGERGPLGGDGLRGVQVLARRRHGARRDVGDLAGRRRVGLQGLGRQVQVVVAVGAAPAP